MSDSTMWEDIGEGFVTLGLSRWTADKTKATAMAYGTLCALILIHCQRLPATIAPTCLEALTNGLQSIDDTLFLDQVLPSASRVAQKWPLYNSDEPFHVNPDTTELIINGFNREVIL